MTTSKRYRICLALTVIASLGIFFWGLGAIPLMSLNEARRAIPVQGIAAAGDWLFPRMNSRIYIDKPPLFYWLGALTAGTAGSTSEWIVRLPSAVSAFFLVWLLYAWSGKAIGRWAAILTAVILMTNATFSIFARRAEIEMLLTALCTASLLAAYRYILASGGRRWIIAGYLLLGLAVLTKGPLCLLFVTLPVLVFALITKNTRAYSYLLYRPGWLVFVPVALSWYLLVTVELGLDAWKTVASIDIADKVYRVKFDPVYDYPLWLLADFLPWSLLFLSMPARAVRHWVRSRDTLFFLCSVLAPLVVFSCFANKHAKYMLPAYPAAALLLASFGAEVYAGWSESKRRWFHGAVVSIPVLYLVYFAAAEPRIYSYRFAAFPQILQALDNYRAFPVYAFRSLDMRVVYYNGRSIPIVDGDEAGEIAHGGEALLLVEKEKWADRFTDSGWCRLAQFKPYLRRHKSALLLGNPPLCRSTRIIHSKSRKAVNFVEAPVNRK